jgi:DNA-binding CsgD family transcriptional regulator/tetratricopeptide (TPR) repeat protein
MAKVSGSALALGRAMWALAVADRDQGDYATAHARLEQAIEAFATINFARGTASALMAMASVAYRRADRNGSRTLCQSALGRWRDLGDRWEEAQTLILLGMVEADDGNVSAASASLAQSIELLRGLGESEASALEGLAYLAAARGRTVSALRIAGAVDHLRKANRGRPEPIERPALERRLARARRLLGGRAAVEWTAGQGLTAEEAVAEVFQELETAARLLSLDNPEPPDGLTRRELDILRLIADGRGNGDIAEALVLSVRTVERHVTNIYSKIGARGRADATAYAFRHGICRAELRDSRHR